LRKTAPFQRWLRAHHPTNLDLFGQGAETPDKSRLNFTFPPPNAVPFVKLSAVPPRPFPRCSKSAKGAGNSPLPNQDFQ
jgi:hypothetical protein